MGCFAIEDNNGRHTHEGDDITVINRVTGDVVAVGMYNTYGWVEGDSRDDMDVFSAAMAVEDGRDPRKLTNEDASTYRAAFFSDYYGNEPKIIQYLRISGMTGIDSECGGCQSIPGIFN